MSHRPIEATEYVLGHSLTCRQWRGYAIAMVRDAVLMLPENPVAADQADDWRRRLAERLKDRVRQQRVGNPVVVFILLNVVVPIVVRLVIEWWLNREGAQSGASPQARPS
ncbi:MAG: hypothetical protein GXX96_31505 [Planctomycetaceae bacterium]|nr:hypothetical protein [Planctomycetaceae bacterium]